MELIRSLREKQRTARQQDIITEASEYICLCDFNSKIYISYRGTPMVPVEESWTPKEILKKLKDTRSGYIEYRNKQLGKSAATAVL